MSAPTITEADVRVLEAFVRIPDGTNPSELAALRRIAAALPALLADRQRLDAVQSAAFAVAGRTAMWAAAHAAFMALECERADVERAAYDLRAFVDALSTDTFTALLARRHDTLDDARGTP